MEIREGDLIEIIYNPQFKEKGYFISGRKYSKNLIIIRIREFISGNEKNCSITPKTYIRYIGKVKNYIYCITNKINGKKYIGRTSKSIKERFISHLHESKYPYSQTPLHIALRKYGKDNFEIEELFSYYADRQKDANIIEQNYIKKYNTKIPNGYNVV